MTRLGRNMLSAFRSLAEHRTRAALSALGVAVGSMAIVMLISIAQGVRSDVTKQVSDLGVNLLVVLPFAVDDSSMLAPNAAGISYLRKDDAGRIRGLPGVRRVAALIFVGGGISSGRNQSPTTLVIATDPDWFRIRPVRMQEGRIFTGADGAGKVCVIGSIPKSKMFGRQSALGRKLVVNGDQYTIVGVTQDKEPGKSQSLFSMASFENIVYIPYETFAAEIPNAPLSRIMVQTEPDREPGELIASVEKALAQRLQKYMYSVQTIEGLLRLAYKIMGILTWLLTGLTSIALFVGGVGIMTVMLMSVSERAREIGIRKATGARRIDIFQQFLAEAALIALGGGAIGLAASWVATEALERYTPIKPLITAPLVMMSFAVCMGVGCVFGLIPAMNAASKDPVAALRSE